MRPCGCTWDGAGAKIAPVIENVTGFVCMIAADEAQQWVHSMQTGSDFWCLSA